MARIGYSRVSSLDQDLDGQVARLQAEGCTIVRSEKVSGVSREGRPELAIVLQFLRAGDELVVTRLDRLGRDTRDVLNLIHECEQRGASVTVLDPHVSTRGEMGHVVLTVLGMVAQMERRFIKERQRGRHRAGEKRRPVSWRQAAHRSRGSADAQGGRRHCRDDRDCHGMQPHANLPPACRRSVGLLRAKSRHSWLTLRRSEPDVHDNSQAARRRLNPN